MFKRLLGLLCAAALGVSCDPFDRELSRREARKEIESIFEISSPQDSTAALAPDSLERRGVKFAIDAGALEGLWLRLPWRDYVNERVASLQLTEKGRQFFKSVQLEYSSGTVELARPLKRSVEAVTEVLGDDEENRVVSFTYRWDAPAIVLRYIGERSEVIQGTARVLRNEGRWTLVEVPLRDLGPFRRDRDAEAPGRAEQEQRCRESNVETELRGTYRFEHHARPTDIESFELSASDVAFTVTRRFESSGRHLQTLTRSHYWGDVLAIATESGGIEVTVFMYRDRSIERLDFMTYRISIDDDGKAQPSLSDAAREMSRAWMEWHERFFDCLPEPKNAWDGR